MDPIDTIDNTLIKKETLYPGSKFVNFKNGTKVKLIFLICFQFNFLIKFQVKFHFQTLKCDANKTVIDDSRKMDKPMELVLGKKFKLEVWEVIVQKMAINEVAKFTVDKSVSLYILFHFDTNH